MALAGKVLSLPPQQSGLALVAENLTVERGGRRLASGLSFRLAAGEALVVTGPNGAGKSSLLRVLAGLLRQGSGTCRLEGVSADEPEPGFHAHYVGHQEASKGALTALENLNFWAAMLRRNGAAGLDPQTALERFSIGHAGRFPAAYLSAGQKRRLALARLLVAPRPLWILDEPATALDVATQAQFAAIMGEHLAAGGLIVAATHAPLGLENARELRLGAAA
jgi:heme exporter protein A